MSGPAVGLGLRSMALERRDEQLRSWRRLLAAYDVDRQLERGYSLTLGADGSLVRSVRDLAHGQEIVTRLADGSVRSTVEAVALAEAAEEVEAVQEVALATETRVVDRYGPDEGTAT